MVPKSCPTAQRSMPDIRHLTERDLPEAQRVVRRAFGTFLGAPDLENFWTDFDYVYSRHGAEHVASFAADVDGALAGVNFATRWGSVGFFGPIAVRSDLWNAGIAQPLVAAACEAFDQWDLRHAGLFTFPHSTKHVWLYQKFGFYPRFLTAVMTCPAVPGVLPANARYSELAEGARHSVLSDVQALCDQVFEGLDLRGEIRTVAARGLGDTLLLWDGASRLAGFAVCQWGPSSEAGADRLFVKFAAVRPSAGADATFAALLDGCSALAASMGLSNVLAGVNLAREEAYRHMLARGFRAWMQGVTMHRPNDPGYSRAGLYVLDDWR